jgi:8-oxo-dGTP diphosphatase
MEKTRHIEDAENFDWKTWKPAVKGVLVFIVDRKQNRVLLIHKKRGMGKGKISAPGGKIEKGETAEAAAIRECQEEVSLSPRNPLKGAELYFQFVSGDSLYVDVFFAYTWENEMAESDEAAPFWCPLDEIPLECMWADDKFWLPQAMEGTMLRGYFIFDDDTMLSEKLEEVEHFDD